MVNFVLHLSCDKVVGSSTACFYQDVKDPCLGIERRSQTLRQAILLCIGDGRGGAGGSLAPPPPPTFLQMVFFLHANARHSKKKVASRCRHAANIAFDLFNIFYM